MKFSFKMKEEMKKVGYDTDKPPVHPTMQQLYVFVKTLGAELNVRQRLGTVSYTHLTLPTIYSV